MTDSATPGRGAAPIWALLVGVVIVAACAYLLVLLLSDQVRAFALGAAGGPSRLMLPLAFGNLLAVLLVWGALWVAFLSSWRRRQSALYVWLGVLVWASMAASAAALIGGVNGARVQAQRLAAEIEQREASAIDRSVAAFSDQNDAELVASVFREMRQWADPIRDVRDLSVSRDRAGKWQAVCGQVSFQDGQWAGFVTRTIDEGRLRAALQQDGFDDAKRKACRPIVDKYVGVDGVDVVAAAAEMKALGCTGLDIYYWEAEKTYCHARVVRP